MLSLKPLRSIEDAIIYKSLNDSDRKTMHARALITGETEESVTTKFPTDSEPFFKEGAYGVLHLGT